MPLDKPDIYNALCVYRELGLKFGRLEKYEKCKTNFCASDSPQGKMPRTQKHVQNTLQKQDESEVTRVHEICNFKFTALPYFDEALQRSPQDVRALLGRARYRAQACKYNDALKDLATLKASDPENIYVFATECLVKYLCCQFEQAMVDNLNKIPIRKKPDNFVLGTMHCEDAIRNNVGSRAGHPLRDHFLIIRKLAWKRNFEKSKPYQPISKFKKKRKELKDEQMTNQLAAPRIKLDIPGDHKPKKDHKKSINSANLASISSSKKLDEVGHSLLNEGSSIEESLHSVVDINEKIPPMREYPFRPIQRYTTNIRNLMSERYLDKMFHDKSFLQRMKVDPAVKSPNDNGVKKIEGLVKKSSKYIHYNQELLRARRPFFLLRLQDAKAGGKLAERQLERERTMMKYCETEAQSTIERIKQAVKEQKLRQTIELAEKMYLFCEATPKKSLPNRNAYLIQLYALVRDGFYGAKTIRSSMSEEQKYTRVAIFLGLPVDKQGSADSLVVQFRAHFLDKKKQCRIIVERVRNATCREELVWLYHELSRLHFDQKQYELSKAYATKCLREAYILKDDKWTVNAMFLMIRVQVLNRNKNGARIELRNCKKVAIKIPDEKMEDFIALCIKILNDTPMEGVQPTKMLEIRTKNIMKLITSDQMRMKAELIFQRINALPPCKRMSVLPGIHYPEIPTQKEPQDKASKEGQPRAKIPSRRKTGENRRGMNFLQLIQYHVDT